MRLNVLNRQPVTEAGFSPIYQAQRRDYSERYSIHEQNATRWRFIAFGCIVLAGGAVGALAYDDSLSKYVPYVVERDHLGDEVAVRVADKEAPVDPLTIQVEIGRWLYDVRTVSPDAQTERHLVYEAYDHTDKSSPATGELNEWFAHNNPFTRAADTIVTITITSVLPVEPNNWKTWRANWKEETRTRSGDLEGPPLNKEVSITVTHRQPTTETEIKKNASGTFVQNFDWKN